MRVWIWILIGGLLLNGCDAQDASSSPAALQPVVSGSGVIRGVVKFSGAAPVMKTSQVPCHGNKLVSITDESVVVNDNGTLRNVFVYLEDAPRGANPDAAPAVLDQVDCRYVPHSIGLQVGQALVVRSSDPTLHNVHAIAHTNRAVNFGMTGAGQERTIRFAQTEFIPVKCDVHPWMLAYVGVFANPWFDVTADQGTFELAGIPAGSYKLVTWHETYGRLEKEVAIADNAAVEMNFDYRRN